MARERTTSESDRLMRRYGVAPIGRGSYGVWDSSQQKWVQTWSGRGSRQKATAKWRALVKA